MSRLGWVVKEVLRVMWAYAARRADFLRTSLHSIPIRIGAAASIQISVVPKLSWFGRHTIFEYGIYYVFCYNSYTPRSEYYSVLNNRPVYLELLPTRNYKEITRLI